MLIREAGEAGNPVVETASGRLGGATGPGGVAVFRGIPYAGPTGKHRFQPAPPLKPWTGIREAKAFGAICPQEAEAVGSSPLMQLFAISYPNPHLGMDEDCLSLNIWTPGVHGRPRPVMVWLHGGGYATGAGSYPTYWGGNLAVSGDVVIVSLNHRLNAFGFLSLKTWGDERYAQSGNVGLLDIIAALRWVKDNIAAFGGDPENITLFGQSGGGGKVMTLLAMPAAHGLFHKAICQSGHAVEAWTLEEAARTTEAYFAVLGIDPRTPEKLDGLPSGALVAALAEVGGMQARRPGWFAPVVDHDLLPRHPFSPDAPPLSRGVPLILGTTRDEASFLLMQPGDQTIDMARLPGRLAEIMGIEEAKTGPLVAACRQDRPEATPAEICAQIPSDWMFRWPALLSAGRKAAEGAAPVFVYLFDWAAPVMDGRYGAYHGIEHPFVFHHLAETPQYGARSALRELEGAMSGAWAAFAATGSPNGPGLLPWPAYDTAHRQTMVFAAPGGVVADPYCQTRAAMEQVPLRARLG